MIDIGKQLPLPSVNWSSLNGNCSLWTVSMISLAILPSIWYRSSFWICFDRCDVLALPRGNHSEGYKTVEISKSLWWRKFSTALFFWMSNNETVRHISSIAEKLKVYRTTKKRGLVKFSMCITVTLSFISIIYFPCEINNWI